VQPEKLSEKVANTLSASKPMALRSSLRCDADAARRRGRTTLSEQKAAESVIAPARKYHNNVQKNPKPLK
jgi:hypothetical protein